MCLWSKCDALRYLLRFSFKTIDVDGILEMNVKETDYYKPTPMQVPRIFGGRDLKTGSGKMVRVYSALLVSIHIHSLSLLTFSFKRLDADRDQF